MNRSEMDGWMDDRFIESVISIYLIITYSNFIYVTTYTLYIYYYMWI